MAGLGRPDPARCRGFRSWAADVSLPKLRRRTQDHCGDPGATGHLEDPHALGPAGPCVTSGASSWPGASSGLTSPNPNRPGDPATRAAGVGCIREFAGPMTAGWRPGIARGRRPRKTTFGFVVNAQRISATFKDRLKRAGRCVRGATGKERGHLKTLSPHASGGLLRSGCRAFLPWSRGRSGRRCLGSHPTASLASADESDASNMSVDAPEAGWTLDPLPWLVATAPLAFFVETRSRVPGGGESALSGAPSALQNRHGRAPLSRGSIDRRPGLECP